MTNTPAYFETGIIEAVKSFIGQAPGWPIFYGNVSVGQIFEFVESNGTRLRSFSEPDMTAKGHLSGSCSLARWS